MTITPLNDRVLVEPKARDEITPGGVVLPETVRHDDSDEGFILDPGTSVLKAGDVVVYTKYAGSEITVDGRKLLLIPQKNIIAVYKP